MENLVAEFNTLKEMTENISGIVESGINETEVKLQKVSHSTEEKD